MKRLWFWLAIVHCVFGVIHLFLGSTESAMWASISMLLAIGLYELSEIKERLPK